MPRVRLTRLLVTLPLACLVVLPLVSLAGSEASLVARLVVVGTLALAAIRPGEALLVSAGLAPLAGPLGALLGTSVGLTEALVLAFLGGWLIHEAMRTPQSAPVSRALLIPTVLFVATVAASCAVQVIALEPSAGDPWALLRQVGTFFTFGYFPEHRQFPSITAGALLLEGVGLYVSVVTLCRRDSSLGQRVTRMVVVSAAGVAAFNLNRLLDISLRGGRPLVELAAGFDPVRISSVFGDVNAAGSYFAMTLLLSGALALEARRARAGWIVAACLILGGLWLTGSRAAFVAVPTAGALIVAATVSWRRRSLAKLAVAVAVALVLVAFATAYVSRSGQRPLSAAANVRVELARTGLRMFSTHPMFGVGVGRYYAISGGFASPQLLRLYPRENAHNNFLQLLAELGIVGFSAFAWLLFAVGRSMWGAHRGSGLSPLALGAAGGLTAFLLTCLSGHPLLIPEVAYAFWLVLGLTAGLVEGPAPVTSPAVYGRRWSWSTVAAGTVALILVVSVPVRARQMISEGSIGRPPVGLSEWQTDKDGTPFRWMKEQAQFSVPAAVRAVSLPLRLDAPADAGSLAVEIYLDGQLVSRVPLAGGNWREFRFIMPPAPPGVHFRRIELQLSVDQAEGGTAIRSGVTAPPRIQVGQPKLTRPPS